MNGPTLHKLNVTRRDLKIIVIITFLFLLFGLNGLGTAKAPESFMKVGSNNDLPYEVMLNLGSEQEVAEVRVYLGPTDHRHVSVFIAENGKWKERYSKKEIVSVFAWNQIYIDAKTSAVDLIFTDAEASIGEIVCVAKNGKVIMPVNALEFPEFFDEQDCYNSPITYYDQTMFDEVYHARTAYEHLNGLPIYEISHPPLGKTLISIGIAVFGMNPFGWRIVCLIFGSLMIPIMYLFALRITKKTSYATLAAILLSTEFMHYSLSRIATIDIIVGFFVLCMFYAVYAFVQEEKRRYLLFAGIASGMGVATKWTACYALFGLAIIIFTWMFLRWRKSGFTKDNRKDWCILVAHCVRCFVLIPAIIYVLSYIPYAMVYTDKNLIEHAISNSTYMYEYHSATVFEHPFSSPWYTWVFNWVPLLDEYTVIGSNVTIIACFVNPLVSFLGLVSVIHHIYLGIVKKNKRAGFLLACYFVMLAPWILITRTVFIYQYFICTLMLILMICHSIECLNFKEEDKMIRIIAVIAICLFVLFFPVISGMEVSRNYVDGFLRWLPRWGFSI